MSLSNTGMLFGDIQFPFNQPCLVGEDSLRLLDDYLEVAENRGFSSEKAKVGFSDWLAVDSLSNATDNSQEDAFSGMDWMVEKMDLKEFDFDALFGIDDLEATVSPDELMATFADTSDLFDTTVQQISNKVTLLSEPIIHSPESPPGADQVAPLTPLLPLPFSPGSLISSADHSLSLELGSEVDVLEGDKKTEAPFDLISKCKREDDAHSDNDSGICLSPESYPESPQESPIASVSSLSDGQSINPLHDSFVRPKPYDRPTENIVTVKMKGEKRIDKKLKKMEQNKTAATRYRQKKRAEQEALSGECRELEQKNETLRDKADSLSKEIQYLKDLIEEVRKAKGKKVKVSE